MLTQLAQHQGPSDELTAAIALAKAYDTWDKLPSREEVEKREAEESAQIAADLAATRLRALEFWKAGVPQYAMTRDIMVETCRDWHLGFDREDGRWTFPFLDEQKRFVGLIGRDIWNRPRETCPKYRCYPGTEKSKYLYGGHLVGPLLRSGSCRTVLLVEGPLDVLRTVQNEFPAVVSSTGCKLSPTQRSLLLAWDPTCVILGYDEDKAGEAGTAGAAAMLRGRVLLKRLALPPKQDPGDLDKDAFAKALYGARLIG
jgi:DNA primase